MSKTRTPRRGALAGLASAAGAAGLAVLAAVALAASPTLGLSATDAVVGQTIKATAQLAEGTAASGEISFEVFGPGDPTCAGPALSPAPEAAPVGGDGEYESGAFEPESAGAYHWSAHYSGDGENEPADSTCTATSTVAKATPSLEGSASSVAEPGLTINDEVTVSGGL